jgi:hypothetical protein
MGLHRLTLHAARRRCIYFCLHLCHSNFLRHPERSEGSRRIPLTPASRTFQTAVFTVAAEVKQAFGPASKTSRITIAALPRQQRSPKERSD